MRRFALLTLLALVPATLVAQRGPGGGRGPRRGFDEEQQDTLPSTATRGYQFGVTTFAGGTWQPSGVEGQLLFRTDGMPFSSVGIGLRLGSFIQNQAVLIGGTQGFFAALVANMRLRLLTLWMVGSERNPTFVKLEVVPEAVASLNANSPMAQGSTALIGSALLGVTIGGRGPMDQTFLLLAGPAWFGPKASEWHAQVSLRFTAPIGGRPSRTPPPN
jgi:hypothetical protein